SLSHRPLFSPALRPPSDLHSFPTRRSSDLPHQRRAAVDGDRAGRAGSAGPPLPRQGRAECRLMAIRVERHESVATIVINRPEARNAVDGPAARALAEAFREFERDASLRVAVLWGAGGTFCAGADLKARGTERG